MQKKWAEEESQRTQRLLRIEREKVEYMKERESEREQLLEEEKQKERNIVRLEYEAKQHEINIKSIINKDIEKPSQYEQRMQQYELQEIQEKANQKESILRILIKQETENAVEALKQVQNMQQIHSNTKKELTQHIIILKQTSQSLIEILKGLKEFRSMKDIRQINQNNQIIEKSIPSQSTTQLLINQMYDQFNQLQQQQFVNGANLNSKNAISQIELNNQQEKKQSLWRDKEEDYIFNQIEQIMRIIKESITQLRQEALYYSENIFSNDKPLNFINQKKDTDEVNQFKKEEINNINNSNNDLFEKYQAAKQAFIVLWNAFKFIKQELLKSISSNSSSLIHSNSQSLDYQSQIDNNQKSVHIHSSRYQQICDETEEVKNEIIKLCSSINQLHKENKEQKTQLFIFQQSFSNQQLQENKQQKDQFDQNNILKYKINSDRGYQEKENTIQSKQHHNYSYNYQSPPKFLSADEKQQTPFHSINNNENKRSISSSRTSSSIDEGNLKYPLLPFESSPYIHQQSPYQEQPIAQKQITFSIRNLNDSTQIFSNQYNSEGSPHSNSTKHHLIERNQKISENIPESTSSPRLTIAAQVQKTFSNSYDNSLTTRSGNNFVHSQHTPLNHEFVNSKASITSFGSSSPPTQQKQLAFSNRISVESFYQLDQSK